MKGVILFLFVLLGGYMEVAATPVLLPQPQEVKWTARKFPLDAVELKEVQLCREELLEWLKEVQCEDGSFPEGGSCGGGFFAGGTFECGGGLSFACGR